MAPRAGSGAALGSVSVDGVTYDRPDPVVPLNGPKRTVGSMMTSDDPFESCGSLPPVDRIAPMFDNIVV